VPHLTIEEVYDVCVSGIGSDETKERFMIYRNHVLRSAGVYEARAIASDLYLTPSHGAEGVTVPLVTKLELKELYEYQMAKKGRPGRYAYDYIRSLAPMGLCPFCGISSARTLDHVMAKSHYPDFTVLPINLVPCCRDCNTEKHDEIFTSIDSQKLHPYFDNVTGEQWLFADVRNFMGPVVSFRVLPPENWDIKLKHKVMSHLQTYDLYNRYGDLACSEISTIKLRISELYDSGGVAAVKAELLGRARDYSSVHRNSWQTAMYQALATNEWYCSGGFN
jgi:hypothetical protein